MHIDLSLSNNVLYNGCEISEVGGRPTLITAPADAINIVGRNINELVRETPATDRAEVTLTGPMEVWAYLVVFHAVVHAFSKVYYCDGRSERIRCDCRSKRILVSQH